MQYLHSKEQINQSQSFISNLIETPPFSPERRQKQYLQNLNVQNNLMQSSQSVSDYLKVNAEPKVKAWNFENFLTFNQNSSETLQGNMQIVENSIEKPHSLLKNEL